MWEDNSYCWFFTCKNHVYHIPVLQHVSGGMRLVHCGGPVWAGPPEIDGDELGPYSIKILDCWFFWDRVCELDVWKARHSLVCL